MAEKGVVMVLKADLHCPSCYKKIKEILCKLPQIRGQIFDVKQNTVTITVVCCCSPEKFRENLRCRGRSVIKSIEIKEPPKETQTKKPPKIVEQPPPPPIEQPPPPPPPVEQPPPRPLWPVPARPPVRTCCEQCAQGHDGGPCFSGEVRTCCEQCAHGHGGGPCFSGEVRTCCEQCAHGHGGGPYFYGYGHGAPPLPPPCYYDSCYYAYGYGCGRCHHVKCVCFVEEHPPSCAII